MCTLVTEMYTLMTGMYTLATGMCTQGQNVYSLLCPVSTQSKYASFVRRLHNLNQSWQGKKFMDGRITYIKDTELKYTRRISIIYSIK